MIDTAPLYAECTAAAAEMSRTLCLPGGAAALQAAKVRYAAAYAALEAAESAGPTDRDENHCQMCGVATTGDRGYTSCCNEPVILPGLCHVMNCAHS